MTKPILALIGPTAVGKTALALNLADKFNLRLISVDSAQIYQGMDIGTAKPDKATLTKYPHALIDILSPEQSYSAAQFCQDAQKEIDIAHQNQQIPFLVGGTMLYYLALFTGLHDLPSQNPQIRTQLIDQIEKKGLKKLYLDLQKIDPISATKINPNDQVRLIRLHEIIAITNQKPSDLFANQKNSFNYPTKIFALHRERTQLHQLIQQRFHQMIKQGLIEEVNKLFQMPKLTINHPSIKSAGYQQIWRYLSGEIDLDQAIQLAIIATRQLAKRQITWINNKLNNQLKINHFDVNQNDVLDKILFKINNFLKNHHA